MPTIAKLGMSADQGNQRFVFPRWANYLLPLLVIGVVGGAAYVPVVVTYGLSARTLNQNYAPTQPVPYSHALHVGELGIDCRYCHTTVDQAAFAAIPPTETCINCHNPGQGNGIRKDSPKLKEVYESYVEGTPINWIKVHQLPDYAYFNHEAHVNKGVSCVSCHSRVDKMEVVYTATPMSMGWCLDCHREPEKHLRPIEEVYNLAWTPTPDADETLEQAQLRIGKELKDKYGIRSTAYMTSCSTCHR